MHTLVIQISNVRCCAWAECVSTVQPVICQYLDVAGVKTYVHVLVERSCGVMVRLHHTISHFLF